MEKTKLTDAQEVAELSHKKTCNWNHTDGCSWLYEEQDAKPLGWAKSRELKKAEKMLRHADKETIIKILKKL